MFNQADKSLGGHLGSIAEHLGEPHGAELRRVDRLHFVPDGQDNFSAAATDVGNGDRLIGKVKRLLHAREGEQAFYFSADNFNVQPAYIAHPAAEIWPVRRLADGGSCDGPKLRDLKAVGNLPHFLETDERLAHDFRVELAGFAQALAESRR